MQEMQCLGWWQQAGYGRQAMRELRLTFHGQQIVGSGIDIIASFSIAGTILKNGIVELVKHYNHGHRVLYVGQYDGEGTLFGKWDIDGYQGDWSIRLLQPCRAEVDEIHDILP